MLAGPVYQMTSVWRSSNAAPCLVFQKMHPTRCGKGTAGRRIGSERQRMPDGIRLCDGARGKKIDEIAIQPFSWKSVYSYSADWTKSIGNTIVPTPRKRSSSNSQKRWTPDDLSFRISPRFGFWVFCSLSNYFRIIIRSLFFLPRELCSQKFQLSIWLIIVLR